MLAAADARALAAARSSTRGADRPIRAKSAPRPADGRPGRGYDERRPPPADTRKRQRPGQEAQSPHQRRRQEPPRRRKTTSTRRRVPPVAPQRYLANHPPRSGAPAPGRPHRQRSPPPQATSRPAPPPRTALQIAPDPGTLPDFRSRAGTAQTAPVRAMRQRLALELRLGSLACALGGYAARDGL